jgi:hypothetical protein
MANSKNEIHVTVQLDTKWEIDTSWEEWTDWDSLVPEGSKQKKHKETKRVWAPPCKGVYEVSRGKEGKDIIYIGSAGPREKTAQKKEKEGGLSGRIIYLISGTHNAGKRIRENENTLNLQVRWARTEYPDALEHILIADYKRRHNRDRPQYNSED